MQDEIEELFTVTSRAESGTPGRNSAGARQASEGDMRKHGKIYRDYAADRDKPRVPKLAVSVLVERRVGTAGNFRCWCVGWIWRPKLI